MGFKASDHHQKIVLDEEKNASTIIKKLGESLPHLPDGRIDYSRASKAAVLICFVIHKDEILILKRSDKVGFYRGKWNVVSGFLDDLKPLKEKAMEEIQEELGIQKEDVSSISVKKFWEFEDSNLQKTWIVFPVLTELTRKPEIILNWENSDFKWIKTHELKKFDTVPHLRENLMKNLTKTQAKNTNKHVK